MVVAKTTKADEDESVYSYLIEECILSAFEGRNLKCPVHGDLFLGQLAPDTVFLDLDDRYIRLKYLRGFLSQYWHLENCVLSTPRQMPQTITNIPHCLPLILTVPQFWYHLARSFYCKNGPFDFERAS